ncbi:hypothetical protein F5X68DRAFT_189710 [Plectosphaerella plurivora]|uniref:Uncharacterized protein n=1 Tax=Plectosphaerella plurivora TaxID=936078 RepID=A0A9P8VES3_9PEZI|nr:hypothetical protein F5X68DRAFT_189710 [Plectosphaerella plurivora]
MATLGRSLKSSSSYLSRARRPGMSPRALSNSSDVSVASAGSNRSEDQLDFVMSAANTPFGELTQAEAMASSSVPPEAQQHLHHHHQASRAPAQRHRCTTVGALSPPVPFPCGSAGGIL